MPCLHFYRTKQLEYHKKATQKGDVPQTLSRIQFTLSKLFGYNKIDKNYGGVVLYEIGFKIEKIEKRFLLFSYIRIFYWSLSCIDCWYYCYVYEFIV